jgi:peptidyl-prolyl cis-trans isomerase SurA
MNLQGIKKWYGAFIILILCGFCDSVHASVLFDRVVAVVNKEVITWSDLYQMMESEATDQLKKLSDEERMKVFKNNEAVFLDKLIDVRLQIQEAKKLGIEVSPEDIKETIENIKKKYSLTDQALEESLKKEGLTLEEYKKRLSDQILISQFINQRIKNKIVISEEEVKKYTDASKESSTDDETFKLRQIFFKKPKTDAEKKVTEEKASLVIQRLNAGEDFSTLAKEYSEDPSGKRGGDLGYIKKDYMAKEFVDVLLKMKPGDFSNPFWTESGLHIIKLDEKPIVRNKAEIEENARKHLVEEEFLDRYKSYIKGLREKAHIEIRL